MWCVTLFTFHLKLEVCFVDVLHVYAFVCMCGLLQILTEPDPLLGTDSINIFPIPSKKKTTKRKKKSFL